MRKLIYCFLAASAVASTQLTGCASSASNVAASAQDAAHALVGQWHDNDFVTYTFKSVDGQTRLVSIIDRDDEAFEVRSAGFRDGFYTIEYFVPSTQYVVTITIQGLSGTELPATWTNSEYDSGEEVFTRVE